MRTIICNKEYSALVSVTKRDIAKALLDSGAGHVYLDLNDIDMTRTNPTGNCRVDAQKLSDAEQVKAGKILIAHIGAIADNLQGEENQLLNIAQTMTLVDRDAVIRQIDSFNRCNNSFLFI